MRAALFSHKFPLGSMHCNALAVSADQTRLMDKDLASSHQVARAVHQALLETSNFLKFSGACVLPALAPDRCKPPVFSQTKPWVKFSSYLLAWRLIWWELGLALRGVVPPSDLSLGRVGVRQLVWPGLGLRNIPVAVLRLEWRRLGTA